MYGYFKSWREYASNRSVIKTFDIKALKRNDHEVTYPWLILYQQRKGHNIK